MRFVKFLSLALFICIGFLQLIFVVFRKGYNTYYAFEQGRLNEIIRGNKYYDVLFIGSSRTYYHINPKIIDSVLNLKSFNAGIDGADLLETTMILKCYLQSHPRPQYVIADLSTPAFDIREASIFNPNMYFSHLDNEIIFNMLRPYKRVGLLKYVPFLQITESDDHIKQGVLAGLVGKKQPLEPTYNGYLESGTDTIPLPFKVKYMTTDFPVSKKGVKLMEELIRTCKNNGIRLIITYAPVYDLRDEKMNRAFFPTLKHICDTSKTPFLNYRYLTLNSDNRMFRDELHLNKYGADIYTRILATDLKKMEARQQFQNNQHQF
jgi:hypothetical protein